MISWRNIESDLNNKYIQLSRPKCRFFFAKKSVNAGGKKVVIRDIVETREIMDLRT